MSERIAATTLESREASAAGTPGNLPLPLTTILGRDSEIDELLDRIDDPDMRLLTLIGPGGVGKTRLSQEVARRAGDRFAHGAWFVPLAAVRDAEQVPAAIAQELSIEVSPGRDGLQQVRQYLERRHLLLVLDNLEHLAGDAAETVTQLVRACPRVTILVTSRVALHVPGEIRHVVLPLAVPANAGQGIDDAGPAVTLFVRQAQAVRRDFIPDRATLATIARICRAVDGLPLAIELAASRIAVLSPGEILARLERPLGLLARSSRNVEPRHQSLRNTIDWSYDLLPVPAQALFRQLSVFAGGLDFDAIDAVCGLPGSPWTVNTFLARLHVLTENHLAMVVDDGESRRITMLETIREFGLDVLSASPDEMSARDFHAAIFLDRASRIGPLTRTSETLVAMRLLRLDWANFQIAADWLVTRGQVDEAVSIYSELHSFLKRENHIEQAKLAHDTWLEDPNLGAESRALALLRSGELAGYLGEREQAIARTSEVVPVFRARGDLEHLAIALIRGFPIPANEVEFSDFIARCEEGLAIAEKLGSAILASYAFGQLCWARLVQGEVDEAMALAISWADITMAQGLEISAANAQLTLGECHGARGEFDEAASLFQAAAATYEKHEVWSSQKSALQQLGSLYLTMRELDRASETLEYAFDLACQRGTREETIGPLLMLAEVSIREFKLEAAIQYARDAIAASEPNLDEGVVCASFDIIAQVAARMGDVLLATTLLGASEAYRRGIGYGQEDESARQTRQLVTELAAKHLGPEAFDAALAEGASMPIGDLVERAMAWQLPGATPVPRIPRAAARAQLSNQELRVLRLMSDGLGNAEIARKLDISSHTATAHVSNILVRLDVTSRTAAVAWAIRNGVA